MIDSKRPFLKVPEIVKSKPVEITPARDDIVFTFGDVAKIVRRYPEKINGHSYMQDQIYFVIFTPNGEKHEAIAPSLQTALANVKKIVPSAIFEQGFKVD